MAAGSNNSYWPFMQAIWAHNGLQGRIRWMLSSMYSIKVAETISPEAKALAEKISSDLVTLQGLMTKRSEEFEARRKAVIAPKKPS